MEIEILKKFCGDDYPEWVKAPWNMDGYTYATDGHVIIRVASEAGGETDTAPLPVSRDLEIVRSLPWGMLDQRSCFRLRPEIFESVRQRFLCHYCSPDAPAAKACSECGNREEDREGCTTCGGVGLEKESGERWNSSQCPSCGGTRWEEKVVWCLRRDEKDLDKNYCLNPRILQQLIENLGVIEFVAPPGTGPVGFRFACGDGLLMPMRSAPWHILANMMDDR